MMSVGASCCFIRFKSHGTLVVCRDVDRFFAYDSTLLLEYIRTSSDEFECGCMYPFST